MYTLYTLFRGGRCNEFYDIAVAWDAYPHTCYIICVCVCMCTRVCVCVSVSDRVRCECPILSLIYPKEERAYNKI